MSPAQPPSAAASSGWRFQLRELLWLVFLVALGLGWWRDHQQQASRAELYERQIAQLLHGKSADVPNMEEVLRQFEQTIRGYRDDLPRPTPNEFVTIVAEGNLSAFRQALESFADSKDAHEAIPGLIKLLSDPRSRLMAVRSLERIKGSSESVVPAIIPLLNDPNRTIAIAAMQALRKRQSAARQAIPALTAMMNEESSPLAVAAAVALKDIDPVIDVSQRLTQLLRSEHAEVRAAAALQLENHVGPEEIERLLTAMYPGERDESVRRAIANTLNRISRFEPK